MALRTQKIFDIPLREAGIDSLLHIRPPAPPYGSFRFLNPLSKRFLALSRYFCGSQERIFRWKTSLSPTSSSPIRASHEPGVKGVSRASTPRTISTIPKAIRVTLRILCILSATRKGTAPAGPCLRSELALSLSRGRLLAHP